MRHSRQVRFAPLGADGQRRIADSTILLVGIGALGTHIAESLGRAGVGRLILVDRDIVELSNLQRQSLFDNADAARGEPKAMAAAEHLRAIDPGLVVHPIVAEFDGPSWDRLPARPDLILDGTDNFATRYILNDLAAREHIPWIYGGVVGSSGAGAVVLPGVTPCLRCWLPDDPTGVPTCETAGVLGPAVAMVASFQATEALKILSGQPDAVTRGLLQLDVWAGQHRMVAEEARPNPGCPACGEAPTWPALHASPAKSMPAVEPNAAGSHEEAPWTTKLCGRRVVQVRPRQPIEEVDLERLSERILERSGGHIHTASVRSGMARFSVEDARISVFSDGRALVFNVDEPQRAIELYSEFVQPSLVAAAQPSAPDSATPRSAP